MIENGPRRETREPQPKLGLCGSVAAGAPTLQTEVYRDLAVAPEVLDDECAARHLGLRNVEADVASRGQVGRNVFEHQVVLQLERRLGRGLVAVVVAERLDERHHAHPTEKRRSRPSGASWPFPTESAGCGRTS